PAGFTADQVCATSGVGGTCTVDIGFAAATAGDCAGLITVDSSSPAGPYVVAVSGVGFDPDGDLALGQQVTSSSQAGPGFGPANLNDGDTSTYFESQDGTFPQTVTLTLDQ